jgi:hypothetical protein
MELFEDENSRGTQDARWQTLFPCPNQREKIKAPMSKMSCSGTTWRSGSMQRHGNLRTAVGAVYLAGRCRGSDVQLAWICANSTFFNNHP